MAGKFCDSPHVAIGPLECRGDREMAQLLRPDRETGLGAEPADDVVDRGAGQTMPFAGPVEIDKQRTGFGAARLEPGGKGSLGRFGPIMRRACRSPGACICRWSGRPTPSAAPLPASPRRSGF